jgi:SynChlorMet cassette protein ScmD
VKPKADPQLIFREEFDDWAILYDPDTGKAMGLNPTAACIWKLCDGAHTRAAMLDELRARFEDPPEELAIELDEFLDTLIQRKLVSYV